MWSSFSFDIDIFQFIHSFAGISVVGDIIAVFIAKYLPYGLLIAAIFFIMREQSWKTKVYQFTFIALIVTLSHGIIAEVIRFFYEHQRPFVALKFDPLVAVDPTNAFPSGHAAFFFALAFAIFFFNRAWGWWFIGAAILNGIARAFVGVHWPTDIIGGIAIAFISFLAVQRLFPPRVDSLMQNQKN